MDELDPPLAQLAHSVDELDAETLCVRIAGELDIATMPVLEAHVAPHLRRGVRRLVLDLSELSFADSSGIALWVSWSRQVPRVELHDAQPMVARVIQTMGLEGTLRLG